MNITDPIFAIAEKSPHALAILDGENPISFRSLCRGVRLVARRFQQAGWQAGDVIGIALPGSQAQHVVVSLALARSGMTQISLPVDGPEPLLQSRIRSSGIGGLVSNAAPAAAAAMTTVVLEAGWLEPVSGAPMPDDVRVAGGDRLWIIAETSGTTGVPKQVGISHAIEDAHRRSQTPLFAHLPGERYLNLSGVRFLTGMKRAICCLSDGGVLALPPPGLTYRGLLQWIDLHHVTYMSCVPIHLHQLLREARTERPRLPSLRILRSSSAALPPTVLAEVRRRISPNLYINYGASEAGPMVAATPELLAVHADTVGRSLEGVELEIVDAMDRPVAAGVSGFVRLRGAGVLSAYLRADAAEQVRVFRLGWCYLGDVGVKNAEGLLFLKGRADEIMNCDGIMISPGEIEAALQQHPAVTEAAAFALPSEAHQDLPAVAFVSPQALPVAELTRFCHDRLGAHAPQKIFQFNEIPKNPAGKVMRRELVALALERMKSGQTGT